MLRWTPEWRREFGTMQVARATQYQVEMWKFGSLQSQVTVAHGIAISHWDLDALFLVVMD